MIEVCYIFIHTRHILGYGVIGNTLCFGLSVMGSSPITPAYLANLFGFFQAKYSLAFYRMLVRFWIGGRVA